MNFLSELEKRSGKVNAALDELLPAAGEYPPIIHEAMRYSLFAGGKRLRPVLALASAEITGGSTEDIMPAACALELIHTYSLVHDDLPAMDNDDLRRGMPTCHRKFGEAMAILAGDALLTAAFELITRCPLRGRITPERMIRVVAEVASAAGTAGLIGGQVVDVISAADRIDGETLAYIHRNKTGAMYRVSVRTGAILSGAGEEDLERLTGYADHLGMAFQITDDILDITGDDQLMGKPSGSDLKNNKATYPALYGMDEARKMAALEADMAVRCLESFGPEADFLRELVWFVIRRSH